MKGREVFITRHLKAGQVGGKAVEAELLADWCSGLVKGRLRRAALLAAVRHNIAETVIAGEAGVPIGQGKMLGSVTRRTPQLHLQTQSRVC